MIDHVCTKVEDIAELRQKVKNIAQTQGRHEGSIDKIESECRDGRMEDMKEMDDKFEKAREAEDTKFEKVLDALNKSGRTNLKMMLTIVIVFGSLFSIYALLFARGGGGGFHFP